MQVTGNGNQALIYNNNDFLAGDVIIHSTNPGTGGVLSIDWTAPTAGTILYSGDVWYAHSPVNRSNDFSLFLNGGSSLASGTVALAQNLTDPVSFSSNNALSVFAGEVLSLQFLPSTGQQYASLAGVNLTVNFSTSTVPVPAAAPLLLSGLGLLGVSMRRKSKA